MTHHTIFVAGNSPPRILRVHRITAATGRYSTCGLVRQSTPPTILRVFRRGGIGRRRTCA